MRNMLLYIIVIIAVVITSGCEDEATETIVDTDIEPDSALASVKVNEAISALENELFLFIDQIENDLIDHPGDIDFTSSNTLFREALDLDPLNLDANFGAGLTEMLIISQDAEVQSAFDQWEAFIDTGTVFEPSGSAGMMSKGTLLPPFVSGSRLPRVSETELTHSYLKMIKMAVTDPPVLEDIQIIIEQNLIPKLNFAIGALEVVDTNSDYTFTVTPKMLGDLDEDALELDLTEIFMMEAGLNLLNSFSNMLVAYSFGFSTYDSAAIVSNLSQGSGFLKLRPNGEASMSQAKTSLLSASAKLDDAIEFLKAEVDDQIDDIIKIGADDLSDSDLDSVTNGNADFRTYLDQGWTMTEDWDGNFNTPDEPLTFKFGSLFDSPVSDFKALLPPYSVTVQRALSDDHTHDGGSINVNADVTPDVAGNYRYYRSHHVEDGFESTDVDTTISIPEFGAVFDSLVTVFVNNQNINYFQVHLDWNGFLNEGSNSISTMVYYDIEISTGREIYSALITFVANNLSEWEFPNPTMNGFLPDLTTDAEFKRIFGIVEADFEKEIEIPFDIHFNDSSDPSSSISEQPLSVFTPWIR